MFRLSLFLIVLFLISCTQTEVKSVYHGFTNETWKENTPIEFSFDVEDTSLQYSIEASFRYNQSLSFNALNLTVSLITPSGSSRFQNILLDLRNNDGSFRGEKKEDYIELDFTPYKAMQFREKGKYVLYVKHEMPVDLTRGIVGIEIKLLPLEVEPKSFEK